MPPTLRKPRWVSPRTGCSTLMTSAPQSARMAPAAGTNVNCASSRTRKPAITFTISGTLLGVERHRKRRRRTEGLAVDVRVVVGPQLDVGQSTQQAFECDAGFQPRQAKTQAGVLAGGEGDVGHVGRDASCPPSPEWPA